jgi:hypothetical protein
MKGTTMEFTFNTNRMYGPEGQIITVTWDAATGIAQFNDKTRCIKGELTKRIPQDPEMPWTQVEMQAIVLAQYDRCNYNTI